MSILAALFIWAMVSETKGRSLEEMEVIWLSSVEKAPYAS
jgi:hypothetical protein